CENWLVQHVRPSFLRVLIADERKTDRRIGRVDGRHSSDRPSSFMPVNWRNALERDMIEIKDEIPYLGIFGFLFLLFERFHPVLEIDNIDPNVVAALRINVVNTSLFLPPLVHSHPAHGRRFILLAFRYAKFVSGSTQKAFHSVYTIIW